ncbi:hypothetical protein F5B18DRAFT_637480 [Nemania serpens]|nr:hypothetical protein F5B18DRAFT_637480 [Nemania serpens]
MSVLGPLCQMKLIHLSIHQSQITQLIQSLLPHDCRETCNIASSTQPHLDTTDSVSQSQDEEGCNRATKRYKQSNSRALNCPETGCRRSFLREQDLVRHCFTYCNWNRPCSNYSNSFTNAKNNTHRTMQTVQISTKITQHLWTMS